MVNRVADISRKTKETDITLSINLDGNGIGNINTDIGFFNHMINLFSFHSGIDITLDAKGDTDICDHHLVEDVGIALGKAIDNALGDKKGIKRYGTVFIPMDEALSTVTLDISGRGYLHFEGDFKRDSIGNFSTEMVKEFFRAIAINSNTTIHARVLYGENDHHKIEGLFKALGRALREALSYGENKDIIPSSKGAL